MKKLLTAIFTLMSCVSVSAAVVEVGYNPDNLTPQGYGFDKTETYDVAVYINDPSLIGATVKGLTVRIPGYGDVSTTSGWLTSELKLKKKNGKNVNDPDILSQTAEMTDDIFSVMFDTPYVVSGAFYAGYSFTVDNLTDETSQPVLIAGDAQPGGLYIHSSRSRMKWTDCVEDAGGVSILNVIVEGDFKDNSASFAYTDGLYASAEEKAVLPVKVVNHGANAINTLTYKYSSSYSSGEGKINFDTPVAATFGAFATVEVDLGYLTESGINDVSLTVTEVNGAANNDNAPTTVFPVKVYPFIPVNRPLVEEYTGLWCGWCVRGYVALETMKERYPEQFIGLAYHDGDPMAIDLERPSYVSGYPSAFVNRSNSKIAIQDIYTIWPEFIKTIAPASIDVNVEWTDDTQSAIKAIAVTRFIEDYNNADFAICYTLLEDGMSDPTWSQYNAYAPEEGQEPKDYPEMPGELGRIFTHGPKNVFGLTYNDVVLVQPQPFGYPGSVPAQLTAGESYSHSCIINVDDIVNVYGAYPVQDKSKLRIVASIIDRKTGHAVNCNTSSYLTSAGMDTVTSAGEIISVDYYDLQGCPVNHLSKGIYLKVENYSDGTRRTSKIIR